MSYNLFFEYNELMDLNINDDCVGPLCGMIYGSIIYTPPEAESSEEDLEMKQLKVGFANLLYYNQALAKKYGVTMAEVPLLKLKINSDALMELDSTLITRETIDEIGAASNPNIILLQHFGVSANWRKKGLSEKALRGVVKQMIGRCGYMVILNPKPVECGSVGEEYYEGHDVSLAGLEKDPEKAQWKLNAFFQRCGFRLFKNYGNVFICNVDQVEASLKMPSSSI